MKYVVATWDSAMKMNLFATPKGAWVGSTDSAEKFKLRKDATKALERLIRLRQVPMNTIPRVLDVKE